MADLRAPSPAELARTAAARARVATLAAGRCARPTTLTVVAVVDEADGHPVVQLEPRATVVPLLTVRPVVRLAMPAAYPFTILSLTGRLEPFDAVTDVHLAYRLALLGARLVGATEIAIPVADYLRARPDPLWDGIDTHQP
jgi:hypothetical protein